MLIVVPLRGRAMAIGVSSLICSSLAPRKPALNSDSSGVKNCQHRVSLRRRLRDEAVAGIVHDLSLQPCAEGLFSSG
jgi:hypothetical protein